MLTTAVFAICITAPLGAIFINTLGTKWLSYDGDDESQRTDHEKGPVIKPYRGDEVIEMKDGRGLNSTSSKSVRSNHPLYDGQDSQGSANSKHSHVNIAPLNPSDKLRSV